MTWLNAVTLKGATVSLEPLSLQRHDELAAAVSDGELWKLWYAFIPTPQGIKADIEERLALQQQGTMLPFAVIDHSSNLAVGMTAFLHADSANRRIEIGTTWYRQSAQRTSLNTQCKLLMLTHAFETLNCIAVEFRTHYFNQASRRAIERLGARLDGVLRNHRLSSNGTLRDTCIYSIINSEWPTVRTHLEFQLDQQRA